MNDEQRENGSTEDTIARLSQAHAALSEPPSLDQIEVWMDAFYAASRFGSTGELEAFVQQTAPFVARWRVWLADYLTETERLVTDLDVHDDWPEMCRRRSVIEMVKRLYAEKCGSEAPFTSPDDTDDLDSLLRQLAGRWGQLLDSQIPSDIPPEHWWWWAPHPPRKRR